MRRELWRPDAVDSRYYRLTVKLDSRTLDEQGFTPQSPAPYNLEDAVAMTIDSEPTTYPARGLCLYCPATERRPGSGLKLTEEHILAEGVGGSLIIPEASCKICADITSAIEGDVQKNLLLAPKRALGIKGKNRNPSPTIALTALRYGRNWKTVLLPSNAHPAMLFLMAFGEPAILGDSNVRPGVAGAWVHLLGSFDAVQKMGITELATPAFDTIRFSQFLAKTAHSFAAATARSVEYEPLLVDFIKMKVKRKGADPTCFNHVGGIPNQFAPSSSLHELALRTVNIRGEWYLSVHIRLFGMLGGPVYTVVVGRLRQQPPILGRALI